MARPMPLELTPTKPTKVHAVYDVRADDATRPDIIPAPVRFGEESTRPDLPARLHLDEESSDRRCAEVRYVRTAYLAHEDWPDVRLAHRQWSSGAMGAVVLHRPNRRTLEATSNARRPSIAELLENRLRHPLVIPVVDLAPVDGELVVVSEYVAGVTLASLLREGGPIRPALAIAIACDVLRALHAGHGATSAQGELLGCVHGSLTPSDVIVGADGRARVVDFSLAETASVSHAERASGRRGYLSPEQVFDRRSDGRTDVFFVGVVLWEILTGYGLLAGDNPFERMMKLVREGFDPPSRFNAEVPDWLDDAVVRALDPSPERRFQSAAEFANALAATLRPASAADVAEYVGLVGGPSLERQQLSRRAASEPPPASGTRRTRPTSGARAKAESSTAPTLRPPKVLRAVPDGLPAAARAPAPETQVRSASSVKRARRLTTERSEREERVVAQPTQPLEARAFAQPTQPLEARIAQPAQPLGARGWSSPRPPRSLRVAAFCAASAAIALLAAVTGVELARNVDHLQVVTPPVVERAPPAPSPKAATPPPATTAEPSRELAPSEDTADVPVVSVDELPLAKSKQRVKPARRWRGSTHR